MAQESDAFVACWERYSRGWESCPADGRWLFGVGWDIGSAPIGSTGDAIIEAGRLARRHPGQRPLAAIGRYVRRQQRGVNGWTDAQRRAFFARLRVR